MSDTRPEGETYTLWGGALSLYSGKVRAYLIKKGLRYREFYAGHPEFRSRVLPLVRLGVTPILETPQNEVLQDSTEIIDFMEQRLPQEPMIPRTPVQRVIARLLDAYGTEHLLLPAMHYRWAEPYRSAQLPFLEAEFGRVAYLGKDRAARNAAGARMMAYFGGMLPSLGGTPETAPAIETAYLDLLERLDLHFQQVPYLLGGRASIADFGLMAPLYAHLARDPEPARLMALRAPNVKRWVERMNQAVMVDAEFPELAPDWPADDALPATLEPVLELLFRDWTPELEANLRCYQQWLQAEGGRAPGTVLNLDAQRRVHPTLGPIEYPLRGLRIRRNSAPQTLWHFEQAASLARALQGPARERFAALMARVGGTAAMQLQLPRAIVRRDHVLVLGETTS
ncbi:Glutathione S-transferase [Solimonas aquatica]|uniref:Glutathione S-transferase n=1 Tax=Solimonas aquatica TaxID=489703 RepID=A0A1H9LUT2_9GAMM|nr:glutathione S-transferase family protein [Solimonas aquatica]SER15196.1 Glutathione S-transferase [Solimonas aquatica]